MAIMKLFFRSFSKKKDTTKGAPAQQNKLLLVGGLTLPPCKVSVSTDLVHLLFLSLERVLYMGDT